MVTVNFGQALEALKQGKRVARHGWNGKNMLVLLVAGSKFTTNREPLLSALGEGVEVEYRPHLDLRAADGTIGVWTPSTSDLLANDWYVV